MTIIGYPGLFDHIGVLDVSIIIRINNGIIIISILTVTRLRTDIHQRKRNDVTQLIAADR